MTGRRRKATSASPLRRTRTEQQTEEDARAYALQQAAAARQAVRCLLIAHHGCTGADCASRHHTRDMGGLCDVLMACGIIPDPLAAWQPGPGYSYSKRQREVAP